MTRITTCEETDALIDTFIAEDRKAVETVVPRNNATQSRISSVQWRKVRLRLRPKRSHLVTIWDITTLRSCSRGKGNPPAEGDELRQELVVKKVKKK